MDRRTVGQGTRGIITTLARVTIDDLKRGGADEAKPRDIVPLRTDWTDKMYGKWPDYFKSTLTGLTVDQIAGIVPPSPAP